MNLFLILAAVLFVISGLCAWGVVRLSALAFAMFGVAAYILSGAVQL